MMLTRTTTNELELMQMIAELQDRADKYEQALREISEMYDALDMREIARAALDKPEGKT